MMATNSVTLDGISSILEAPINPDGEQIWTIDLFGSFIDRILIGKCLITHKPDLLEIDSDAITVSPVVVDGRKFCSAAINQAI
jgi:hypothetical protein